MENIIKQFDAYLKGKLSDADLNAFEHKLNKDSKFRNQFESHKESRASIETFFLQKSMDQWHSSIKKPQESSGKKGNNKLILWILSLLFVAAMTLVYFLLKKTPVPQVSEQVLFAELYYPHPGLPTTMSAQSEMDFGEGMVAYKSKDYAKAIALWNRLTPQNDTLIFFKASAFLAEEDGESARRLFSSIPESSVFFNPSRWYLALYHLNQEESSEALNFINQIRDLDYKSEEILKIRTTLGN